MIRETGNVESGPVVRVEVAPPPKVPALLCRAALADYLGVSVRTLDRWVQDCGFPRGFRPEEESGSPRRWSRAAVDAWIRDRSAKVNGGARNHGGAGWGGAAS